ncbi:DUF2167 domain-containing protein [Sphingomicrobium arenosum]|uniref:DUF2167 domain-containing protein n=1 Tax=Sphingomicrobium arenosum TaxID=2233861 RepID=UPI002240A4BE|nr:DUF2167 domain-containing protein [Sphingomicrobium arenosum]
MTNMFDCRLRGAGLAAAAAVTLSLLTSAPAMAQDAAEASQSEMTVEEFIASMPQDRRSHWETIEAGFDPSSGTISVGGAHSTMDLGEDYAFYPAQNARDLLEFWGNDPSQLTDVLGLIMPANKHPLDAGWSAVVTYEESGHVADDDAADIDYDELLEELQEGQRLASEQAREHGYPGGDLLGWAQAPSYDSEAKTLVWAKRLQFDDTEGEQLNYDVRLLGRTGVLSINMLDGMEALPEVQTAALQLSQRIAFEDGARYADFNPETDAKAEYGIGGLILGGAAVAAAKKTGLLAFLFLFLKKGWIVIVIALAALGRKVKGTFGKGEDVDAGWDEDAAYVDPESEAMVEAEDLPASKPEDADVAR